jgi:hypothetical protein
MSLALHYCLVRSKLESSCCFLHSFSYVFGINSNALSNVSVLLLILIPAYFIFIPISCFYFFCPILASRDSSSNSPAPLPPSAESCRIFLQKWINQRLNWHVRKIRNSLLIQKRFERTSDGQWKCEIHFEEFFFGDAETADARSDVILVNVWFQ